MPSPVLSSSRNVTPAVTLDAESTWPIAFSSVRIWEIASVPTAVAVAGGVVIPPVPDGLKVIAAAWMAEAAVEYAAKICGATVGTARSSRKSSRGRYRGLGFVIMVLLWSRW